MYICCIKTCFKGKKRILNADEGVGQYEKYLSTYSTNDT